MDTSFKETNTQETNPIFEYLHSGKISPEIWRKIGEEISDFYFSKLFLKIAVLIRDFFDNYDWSAAQYLDGYFENRSIAYIKAKNQEFIEKEFKIDSKFVGWQPINAFLEQVRDASILRNSSQYNSIKNIFQEVMGNDSFIPEGTSDKPLFNLIFSLSTMPEQDAYLIEKSRKSSIRPEETPVLIPPSRTEEMSASIEKVIKEIVFHLRDKILQTKPTSVSSCPLDLNSTEVPPYINVEAESDSDDSVILEFPKEANPPVESTQCQGIPEVIPPHPIELILEAKTKDNSDAQFSFFIDTFKEFLNTIEVKSEHDRTNIKKDIASLEENLVIVRKFLSSNKKKISLNIKEKEQLTTLKTDRKRLQSEIGITSEKFITTLTNDQTKDFLNHLAEKPTDSPSTNVRSSLNKIQSNKPLTTQIVILTAQRVKLINQLNSIETQIKLIKTEALENDLNKDKGFFSKISLTKNKIQPLSERVSGMTSKLIGLHSEFLTKVFAIKAVQEMYHWKPDMSPKEKEEIENAVGELIRIVTNYYNQFNDKYKMSELLEDLGKLLAKLEESPFTSARQEEKRKKELGVLFNQFFSKIFNANLQTFHPLFSKILGPILNPQV